MPLAVRNATPNCVTGNSLRPLRCGSGSETHGLAYPVLYGLVDIVLVYAAHHDMVVTGGAYFAHLPRHCLGLLFVLPPCRSGCA